MSNSNDFYEIEYDPADFEDAAPIQVPTAIAAQIAGEAKKSSKIKNSFFGYQLPAGIELDGVDIENPPGLAGEIVNLMRDGAHRQIKGGAYALTALQVMAATAGKIRGVGNCKLSLVTITLGLSAAGKERPQSVAKSLLDGVGVIVSGDIRSDKDVLRTVITHDARCIYIVDEAQKLLARSDSKTETPATKNIQSTLLELITSDNFKLSAMHKAEFSEKYYNQLAKLEKELLAKEADIKACNPIYDGETLAFLECAKVEIIKKINEANRRIMIIDVGVKDSCVNLSAFSTPAKMADFIDEIAIESGFLGRGLIADCGVDAEPLNRALMDDKSGTIRARLDAMEAAIVERLKSVYALSLEESEERKSAEYCGGIFRTEQDAEDLINEISDFYDIPEYRNHARLGPLFRRIIERLFSVASILSLDSVAYQGVAIVKKEHVLYALAIILRSISMLESNLKINEGATSERMQDKLKALETLIINQLNKSEFKYKSAVKNKATRGKFYKTIEDAVKSSGQDAFENAINGLASNGEIVISDCKKKLKLA